jgi:hypothetical protein
MVWGRRAADAGGRVTVWLSVDDVLDELSRSRDEICANAGNRLGNLTALFSRRGRTRVHGGAAALPGFFSSLRIRNCLRARRMRSRWYSVRTLHHVIAMCLQSRTEEFMTVALAFGLFPAGGVCAKMISDTCNRGCRCGRGSDC